MTTTAQSLDAFAAVADLRGHSRESVALLIDASRKLKAGELDERLSVELATWSAIAASRGQSGFASVLQDASASLG